MQAWCIARTVDYNLGVSAMDRAETALRLPDDEALADEQSLQAAEGLFYQAIGSDEEAATAFAASAQLCRKRHVRVPCRLRLLTRLFSCHALHRGPRGTLVSHDS